MVALARALRYKYSVCLLQPPASAAFVHHTVPHGASTSHHTDSAAIDPDRLLLSMICPHPSTKPHSAPGLSQHLDQPSLSLPAL